MQAASTVRADQSSASQDGYFRIVGGEPPFAEPCPSGSYVASAWRQALMECPL